MNGTMSFNNLSICHIEDVNYEISCETYPTYTMGRRSIPSGIHRGPIEINGRFATPSYNTQLVNRFGEANLFFEIRTEDGIIINNARIKNISYVMSDKNVLVVEFTASHYTKQAIVSTTDAKNIKEPKPKRHSWLILN